MVTTCFQRDSRKDQIVVLTFIAGTVGLLVWAAVKRVLENRETGRANGGARVGEREGEYVSVGGR